jgi:hypothetical protein
MTEGVVPVEDDVDRHTLAAKAGPDRAGKDLEILDDQNSHELSPLRRLRIVAKSSSRAGRDDIGPTMTEPRCHHGVSG